MGWVKCGEKEFFELSKFLLENEKITLSITSRLVRQGSLKFPNPEKASLFFLRNNRIISTILMVTNRGDLYFSSLKTILREEAEDALLICESAIETIKTVYAIPMIPPKELLWIIEKIKGKNKKWEHYCNRLLLFNPKKAVKKETPFPFSQILYNHDINKKKLETVHSLYLREEVSTPLRPINKQQADAISYSMLKKERIIAGIVNTKIVSKANTNMQGINVAQLGGIFTVKNYRRQGAASSIVRRLSEDLSKEKLEVILFVKESNIKALNVYKNSGFEEINTISLIYFS